mgnify:CR=1 FL=1
MQIERWWPQLSRSTQEWLIANNGDVLAEAVVQAVIAAGGRVEASALSDAETDWIEAMANDETPPSSG